MFRLIRLLFLLTVGFYGGFQFSLWYMGSQCETAGGTMNGTLCVGAAAPQGADT